MYYKVYEFWDCCRLFYLLNNAVFYLFLEPVERKFAFFSKGFRSRNPKPSANAIYDGKRY